MADKWEVLLDNLDVIEYNADNISYLDSYDTDRSLFGRNSEYCFIVQKNNTDTFNREVLIISDDMVKISMKINNEYGSPVAVSVVFTENAIEDQLALVEFIRSNSAAFREIFQRTVENCKAFVINSSFNKEGLNGNLLMNSQYIFDLNKDMPFLSYNDFHEINDSDNEEKLIRASSSFTLIFNRFSLALDCYFNSDFGVDIFYRRLGSPLKIGKNWNNKHRRFPMSLEEGADPKNEKQLIKLLVAASRDVNK